MMRLLMILRMTMSDDKKNELVIHSASELTLKFPKANEHIPSKEAEQTRNAVATQGAYTPDGKAYVNKKALPKVLATDKKGVNRFVNDLDDEDKMENGPDTFVSAPAVMKEISERIQWPIDTIKKEKLRDSEGCVKALRDAPELDKIREVKESNIRKELPGLKKKKIKAENVTACQVSNEPLQPDAHAHHIERKADNPSKALDLDNIAVVNPEPHDEIHEAGAESREELSELCKKKGWNDPTKS